MRGSFLKATSSFKGVTMWADWRFFLTRTLFSLFEYAAVARTHILRVNSISRATRNKSRWSWSVEGMYSKVLFSSFSVIAEKMRYKELSHESWFESCSKSIAFPSKLRYVAYIVSEQEFTGAIVVQLMRTWHNLGLLMSFMAIRAV